MPQYYHTNFTPQFGDPILPPKKPAKKKSQRVRGSWYRPSRKMIERELAKCRVTHVDPETGSLLDEQESQTKARPTKYGQTGRTPHMPKRC